MRQITRRWLELRFACYSEDVRRPRRLAIALVSLVTAACEAAPEGTLDTPYAGSEDARPPDARAADGSWALDAGAPLDTGAPLDAGTPLDAGAPTARDASAPADASAPDAGSVDAGGAQDAGERPALACTPSMTDNERLPYCFTQIGDIELKLFPPDHDGAGLAVYLHGDTANGYFEDWGFEALIEPSQRRGRAFVAALAPNRCSWWRAPGECRRGIEDPNGYNATQLAAALDHVIAAYAIDRNDLRYVGYSGGSTFLLGHFLPLFGATHSGVVVANCGGEVPIYSFAWNVNDAGLRARAPIHLLYGSNDFMREYLEPGRDEYLRLGFMVEDHQIAGASHCDSDVDWDALTLARWN